MSFDLNKFANKEYLLKKAKNATQKLDDISRSTRSKVVQVAEEKINQVTGNETTSKKLKEQYQKIDNFSQKMTGQAIKTFDHAAGKTASTISDVTGRETSAEEVKKAAIAAALVISASGPMDALAAEGGVEACSSSSPEALNPSDSIVDSNMDQAGSFEEETHKFFADKGGLNIHTDVIDSDGCILDSGA